MNATIRNDRPKTGAPGGSLDRLGSAFPERDMVPNVSSPRWESMSEESQARWREIHAMPCIYCGRPISEQFWMLTWPDGRRAHEACHDDSIEAERALANNPFEIDRAARAAKMTQEGFKLLPSWERLRLIRETQNDKLSHGHPTTQKDTI